MHEVGGWRAEGRQGQQKGGQGGGRGRMPMDEIWTSKP